jgi:membrane fusion protein, copper/silver efflux system
MNARPYVIAVTVLAALAAAAYAGYRYAGVQRPHAEHAATPAAVDAGTQAERRVLYWHDPMYPQHRFDSPGKSPFMDMDLVPVYGGDGDTGTISISARMAQNLGIRSAAVETGTFWRRVDTVGTVQADERRSAVVQVRTPGWVEKLHVRATNDPVRRGQTLAEIYAPELLAAQEEYLLVRKRAAEGALDASLAAAARDRLLLLGMTSGQIDALDADGRATRRVALQAPISGVVTELGVREGQEVATGTRAFALVDLSRIWIVAEVPEAQLGWIATGRPLEARFKALPGETFEGAVEYIYPEIDAATRTVKVRATLANPEGRLKPGMVAEVALYGGPKRETVLVPSEALIYTGTRTVVILDEGEGRFRPVEVNTGFERQGRTEILQGLSAGQRVVVSGQFLIDSEANLKTALSRLEPEDDAAVDGDTHTVRGTVRRIDHDTGEIVIAHGAIDSLGMPGMTMGFAVSDHALLNAVQPGQEVDFVLGRLGEGYAIVHIAPARTGEAQP